MLGEIGGSIRAIGRFGVVTLFVAACGGSDDVSAPPDGNEVAALQIGIIGDQVAGEAFNVLVTLVDAQGTAVSTDAESTISLDVAAGIGALGGNTSGSIAAGSSAVTITGVTYDHAEDGVRLEARGDGGGGDDLVVVSNAFTLDFDFSGNLVAFRREVDDEEIYLMKPDGSAFVNLTDHPEVDADAAWSPDGSRIAFVSTRSGNADLWVMNVDGSGLVQVTDDQGSIRFPDWSPDGTLIAYSANVDDQRDIYVIEAPGPVAAPVPPPVQVTNHPAVDNEPVWSPEGDKIVFFSTRDGSDGSLWSIDFTGTGGENPVELTPDFDFACAPRSGWSITDGRVKLSFVGEIDDRLDIWTMDFDGSNQTNVTDDPESDFYSDYINDAPPSGAPGPSPDEEGYLIFDSNRDGPWQLYSITENGTDLIRLTDYPAEDRTPRWRPVPDGL